MKHEASAASSSTPPTTATRALNRRKKSYGEPDLNVTARIDTGLGGLRRKPKSNVDKANYRSLRAAEQSPVARVVEPEVDELGVTDASTETSMQNSRAFGSQPPVLPHFLSGSDCSSSSAVVEEFARACELNIPVELQRPKDVTRRQSESSPDSPPGSPTAVRDNRASRLRKRSSSDLKSALEEEEDKQPPLFHLGTTSAFGWPRPIKSLSQRQAERRARSASPGSSASGSSSRQFTRKAADDPATQIQLGSRVEAEYKGVWYQGTVKGLASDDASGLGRYAIHCDDDQDHVLLYTNAVRLLEVSSPITERLTVKTAQDLGPPLEGPADQGRATVMTSEDSEEPPGKGSEAWAVDDCANLHRSVEDLKRRLVTLGSENVRLRARLLRKGDTLPDESTEPTPSTVAAALAACVQPGTSGEASFLASALAGSEAELFGTPAPTDLAQLQALQGKLARLIEFWSRQTRDLVEREELVAHIIATEQPACAEATGVQDGQSQRQQRSVSFAAQPGSGSVSQPATGSTSAAATSPFGVCMPLSCVAPPNTMSYVIPPPLSCVTPPHPAQPRSQPLQVRMRPQVVPQSGQQAQTLCRTMSVPSFSTHRSASVPPRSHQPPLPSLVQPLSNFSYHNVAQAATSPPPSIRHGTVRVAQVSALTTDRTRSLSPLVVPRRCSGGFPILPSAAAQMRMSQEAPRLAASAPCSIEAQVKVQLPPTSPTRPGREARERSMSPQILQAGVSSPATSSRSPSPPGLQRSMRLAQPAQNWLQADWALSQPWIPSQPLNAPNL
jgi:hypothetical protein